MGKFEELLFEAEAVSYLMVQIAHDDVGDTSFAVMADLGENGTEHECDLAVSEVALRASAVIIALLAELEAKDKTLELEREKSRRVMSENHKQAERIADLEAKLATPVLLSDTTHPRCRLQHADDVRAAGLTVEGDE